MTEPDRTEARGLGPADGIDAGRRGGVSLGTFGMLLFLASLTVLFAASLAAYVVVRSRAEQWPPPGAPSLPSGLWLSTGILLACSVAIHTAKSFARQGWRGALAGALVVTSLLGLAFLLNQWRCWQVLRESYAEGPSDLFALTFYMLTGLHGLHVIGGIVLLVVVTWKALARRYTVARHAGVQYAAMYWHFLDGVWLILFAVLLLTS
jgi:cytochrome c oxidase subunit 3